VRLLLLAVLLLAVATAAVPPKAAEGSEEIVIYGDPDQAREQVEQTLAELGYGEGQRRADGRTEYVHPVWWYPVVWLDDDGYLVLRETLAQKAAGLTDSRRKLAAKRGQVASALAPGVEAWRRRISDRVFGERIGLHLPDMVVGVWDRGEPLRAGDPPLRTAAERRAALLAFHHGRVDNRDGELAREVVEGFLIEVVQPSPWPFTAGELELLSQGWPELARDLVDCAPGSVAERPDPPPLGPFLVGSVADRAAFLDLVDETRTRSEVFEAAWRNLRQAPEPAWLALGRDVVVGWGPTPGFVRIDAFEYGAPRDRVRRARGWQTVDLADLEGLPLNAPPGVAAAQDRGASLVHTVVEAHVGRTSNRATSAGRYRDAHGAALVADAAYRLEQGQPEQTGVEVIGGPRRAEWVYTYADGTRETLRWHQGALVAVDYEADVAR